MHARAIATESGIVGILLNDGGHVLAMWGGEKPSDFSVPCVQLVARVVLPAGDPRSKA